MIQGVTQFNSYAPHPRDFLLKTYLFQVQNPISLAARLSLFKKAAFLSIKINSTSTFPRCVKYIYFLTCTKNLKYEIRGRPTKRFDDQNYTIV